MTPCLDHQPTRDANGKPLPAVTGKHYNYAQRKHGSQAQGVGSLAAELRRIVGTPEIRRSGTASRGVRDAVTQRGPVMPPM